MHMADALLSPGVGLGFLAVSGGAVGFAANRLARDADLSRRLPTSGLLAAFVFAAQMVNFAIPGTGSSGHLGGGLLLGLLLGPEAGLIAIASVLLVQALFFADGGLLAAGTNVFNLGVIPCFLGVWLAFTLSRTRRLVEVKPWAMMVASVVGLQLGALGVTLQTLLSGRTDLPFTTFAGFMLGIHLPIGIVEGLITVAVVRFIVGMEGQRIRTHEVDSIGRTALGSLVILTLLTGMVVAWFASGSPDGLEWSIEHTAGVESLGSDSGLNETLGQVQERTSFLPDYAFAGDDGGSAVGTSISGVVGAVLTALLLAAILVSARFMRHPRPDASAGS